MNCSLFGDKAAANSEQSTMSTDSTVPNFHRMHDCYRYYRSRGLSRIESLRTVKTFHPEINREFCLAQERAEGWTREPLDFPESKRLRNEQIVRAGGKLP